MANRPVHFEIPADDTQRAVKFYQELFGWDIKKWDSNEFEYWMIVTGETNTLGINGAIYPRPKGAGSGGWIITMDVVDIDGLAKKVVELGGKVTTEPADMPGVGRLCQCLDTEGNAFGMIKPDPAMAPMK